MSNRNPYGFDRRARKESVSYCDGKVCYDKKGAQTAANARWKQDHIELRIYPHYDHWHLTSRI